MSRTSHSTRTKRIFWPNKSSNFTTSYKGSIRLSWS